MTFGTVGQFLIAPALLVISLALVFTAAAAGGWSPPISLAARGIQPQVAADSAGDAVAVWRGGDFTIQAASWPAGGPRSAPVSISGRPGTAFLPQIALDSSGDAVALWDLDEDTIQAATRPHGGPWSPPVTVSAAPLTGPRVVFELQLALDAGGDAVAVWSRISADPQSIPLLQVATRPAGGPWSAPVDLARGFGPKVALDARGDAVIVWQAFTEGYAYSLVYASSKPAGGSWSASVALSALTQRAYYPRVALDSGGNALAVWTLLSPRGAANIVQAASRPVGQSWSAPIDLSPPGGQGKPALALNARGDAVVLWRHATNYPIGVIQATRRPAGGSWGAPVTISGRPAHILLPRVALDSSGDAIAVWGRLDASRPRYPLLACGTLQSSRMPAGDRWGPPLTISGGKIVISSLWGIASGAVGDAVAVWGRCERVPPHIYASLFTP